MKLPDTLKNVILRPLFLFSLSFYVLLCLLHAVGGADLLLPSAVFLFAALCFALLFFFYRKRSKPGKLFFALFMLFLGVGLAFGLSFFTYEKTLLPISELDGKTVAFRGTVTETVSAQSYGSIYTVRVSETDSASCDFYAQVTGESGFTVGDRIKAVGKADALFDEKGAPTEEGKYSFYKGTVLSLECEETEYTGKEGFSLTVLAHKVRSRLTARLRALLSEKEGGFAAALLLGERSYLEKGIVRDFKRLGISHVLALSGMHLSVICSFAVVGAGERVRLRRVISALTVVLYMVLTGFSPSVTRSGIMLLLMLSAQLFKRGGDMLTNTGCAAALICAFDPFAAGDIGLQLSVAAVMALALATGEGRRREIAPKRTVSGVRGVSLNVVQGLYVGVCVTVFLLPLQGMYFAMFSPVSPLVSLAVSFLAGILLQLLLLAVIFMPFPGVSEILAYPARWLIQGILYFTEKLSLNDWVTVSLNYKGALILCFAACTAFLIFSCTKGRRKILSGMLCVALFVSVSAGGYIYPYADKTTEAVYVNHGKSDAVVLYSGGVGSVVDIGNGYSSVLTKAGEELSKRGCAQVESLVLTHLHKPYTASLNNFFRKYRVKRLLVPQTEAEEGMREALLAVCRENGVAYESYAPGDILKLLDCTELSTYPHKYISRSVQPMIRLDIASRGKTVTYLSSAYSEIGERVCADTVILGSHGPLYKKTLPSEVIRAEKVIGAEYAKEFFEGTTVEDASFIMK